MQQVDSFSELDRQHCPVSIALKSKGDLEDPAANPLNGLASLGMPPNWISCNSSPISFCAPFGNACRFRFELPIQTRGRNTGVSWSSVARKVSRFRIL